MTAITAPTRKVQKA